jgi:DNA-binding transcriptional ArsR family regulator
MPTDHVNNIQSEHLGEIAFLAKSLSDINRLRILLALEKRSKSVSVLVEELGLSQPLVSHHLRELRRTVLVSVDRKGPFVFYSLTDERVVGQIHGLMQLAKSLLAQKSGFG